MSVCFQHIPSPHYKKARLESNISHPRQRSEDRRIKHRRPVYSLDILQRRQHRLLLELLRLQHLPNYEIRVGLLVRPRHFRGGGRRFDFGVDFFHHFAQIGADAPTRQRSDAVGFEYDVVGWVVHVEDPVLSGEMVLAWNRSNRTFIAKKCPYLHELEVLERTQQRIKPLVNILRPPGSTVARVDHHISVVRSKSDHARRIDILALCVLQLVQRLLQTVWQTEASVIVLVMTKGRVVVRT